MSDQGHPEEWEAPCVDAGGRDRKVVIKLGDNAVTIVHPPGETATFTVGQLHHYQEQLRQAAIALSQTTRGGRRG